MRDLEALQDLATRRKLELRVVWTGERRYAAIGTATFDFSCVSWQEGLFGALIYFSALEMKDRLD